MEDSGPYADASGAHVCPQMVKADLSRLESAAKTHQAFADKLNCTLGQSRSESYTFL